MGVVAVLVRVVAAQVRVVGALVRGVAWVVVAIETSRGSVVAGESVPSAVAGCFAVFALGVRLSGSALLVRVVAVLVRAVGR